MILNSCGHVAYVEGQRGLSGQAHKANLVGQCLADCIGPAPEWARPVENASVEPLVGPMYTIGPYLKSIL